MRNNPHHLSSINANSCIRLCTMSLAEARCGSPTNHPKNTSGDLDARPGRSQQRFSIPSKHFCILLSTLHASSALRNYFVPILKKELASAADRDDIITVFERVNSKMVGQTPECQTTLDRKFPVSRSEFERL